MSTIVHAILGYFFLLLTVRILSRRPGAQLTLFEFVLVFLIGGVIILATVGDDGSVTNCAIDARRSGAVEKANRSLRPPLLGVDELTVCPFFTSHPYLGCREMSVFFRHTSSARMSQRKV